MSDYEFRAKVVSRLAMIAASLISLQVFVTLMAFIVCNQLQIITDRLPLAPTTEAK